MRNRSLIALAVAAGFAVTAQAGGDKTSGASAGKNANSSAAAGAGASGAEKMFQALDKNNDGQITREEARGTPHAKDFATLDKNRDGNLSREEHAAAPEHTGGKAAAGGTQPQSTQPKSKY